MRKISEFEKYRVRTDNEDALKQILEAAGAMYIGSYQVQVPKSKNYLAVVSIDKVDKDTMMEHISISHKSDKVTPTWDDLCYLKDVFFADDEECVQFFPKKSEYVNVKQNCFHLWRYVD